MLVPRKFKVTPLIKADETIYYDHIEETLLDDLRFKLIFNFTNYNKIHTHYEKLSAFEILNLEMIKELASEHAKPHHDLSDLFKRALCKPGSIWQCD